MFTFGKAKNTQKITRKKKEYTFREKIYLCFTIMQPLFNRVFVVSTPEEQKSSSGLIIPQSDLVRGKVLFAGHTCAPSLIEGSSVLFEKGTGLKFNYEGQDGLFFHDKDLITIL